MKRIVLSMLLAGVGLVAAEGTAPYKSGLLLPPKGDLIYAQECALCHGKDAKQTKFKGLQVTYAKIGGMDAAAVAQTLKEYKGGIKSKDYGPLNKYGYGALMKSTTKDLSWDEIDAVAKYVNSLK